MTCVHVTKLPGKWTVSEFARDCFAAAEQTYNKIKVPRCPTVIPVP